MWVLAVETATDVGSVALGEAEGPFVARSFERGMIHGREIAPAVDALLRERGLTARDLGLLAVDVGPGSYTGLRVGLAAVKGLAYATRVPVVGVVSLDALAGQAQAIGPVCALLDAKWRQIYAALYDGGRRVSELWAIEPAALRARLPAGAVLAGDAAVLEPGAPRDVPRAETVAALGVAAFRARGGEDAARMVPLYLRPTEAEQKFGAGARHE